MNIKNEIIEFINAEESNGALLITGQWGCGKSYLVKKIVKDLDEEGQYAIAVVSLFGVDSIASLNATVRNAYLEFCSSVFGKKAQKVFGTIKKVANESAKITAAAMPESVAASAVSMGVSSALSFNPLSFISVKNTVRQGKQERKFALVFDDFERSNIEVKDLLGAINEYSENKNIKTILIADEEKIKDVGYEDFKEKVVSRTLRMSSNYQDIINSIVDGYKTDNEAYKTFLVENMECIVGAFTHSGYSNLRTLKSCIIDFERIYAAWSQSGVSLDDIESIFYKFCVITYETKKGLYQKGPYEMYTLISKATEEKARDAETKEIRGKYLDGAFDHIPNSIAKWVVSGDWDEHTFVSELKRYYNTEELSNEDRFIRYRIWDLEQDDINIGLVALLGRAYKGEASRDELIALLQKVHILKEYGVPLPCEVDYQRIDAGFEQRKEKIKNGALQEPAKYTFTEDSQIDSEARFLNKKIEDMGNQIFAWENRREFVNYLKRQHISRYSLKNKCLKSLDDDLCQLFWERYISATNGDRRELCWTLLSMDYDSIVFSTPEDIQITIRNMGVLISKLQALPVTDSNVIGSAINKAFIENIEKTIEELQGETNCKPF